MLVDQNGKVLTDDFASLRDRLQSGTADATDQMIAAAALLAYHQMREDTERKIAEPKHAIENAAGWLATMQDDIKELRAAVAVRDELDSLECVTRPQDGVEAVEEKIHGRALTVMVRDGWREPYGQVQDGPEEYEVLLTWGGPALRIVGKLTEHNQPDDFPRLEYQDWGVPWTEYTEARPHREAICEWLSVFHFGE